MPIYIKQKPCRFCMDRSDLEISKFAETCILIVVYSLVCSLIAAK
jgi:hypothetical protein